MPAVAIPAVLSAGFSFASGATLLGLTVAQTALLVGGSSLILGGLSYALTPKPRTPSFGAGNVPRSTVSVRQPDFVRQHVYGHTRITRGYAHMESTGVNGVLHIILILCEGELRAINEIWMDDYVIPNDWIDSNGNVTQGRYAGYLQIRKHLGQVGQAADAIAVANMPSWTNDHKLEGIAYLYIKMTKNQDIYPNGVPNISAVVEGPTVFDPRTSTNVWSTNIALYAHDFLSNTRYGYGVLADDVDPANISAQANICDEIVDTETEDSTVQSWSIGSNIITFTGDVLKLQFGDRVRVLSTGTYPGGISPGTDYYVIPYQVKGLPRIRLATSFQNAMDKISIDITSGATGTLTVRKTGEPRYHGSGIFEADSNLSETLNNIVSSMAGRAIHTGGFWTLLAGAWRTPTVTLEAGDWRGNGIGYKNGLSMSESYNVVKGLFVSQLNSYQPTDYPSARYEEFIEDDNGIVANRDLNLPFTQRPTTAQRIAKIELFRGRQDIVVTGDFSMKAFQLQPGDNTDITLERLGWENKPFEITEFGFDVNNGSLVTKLTLRETAQQIFDWSEGEAIGYDPAPNTNLPNPFDVLVPTGVNFNSRVIDTSGGDALYVMQLQWDVHPDLFVREFGDFEIQYKLSSALDWLPSFFVDGSLTKTDVFNSSVNVYYDMRIRARNNLGVRSQWVTIYNAVVGSSGGVTDTDDWELFSDPISIYKDWATFSDPVTITEDWGFFS